jgi:hypothetical protein
LELNDAVVQGLALAQLALQAGHTEAAQAAVAGTLQSAQAIVSELLASAGESGRLQPGDLVRATPATVTSVD